MLGGWLITVKGTTNVKRQPHAPELAETRGPDQIDVEVGVNLRRLRLLRNHSQTALADALGVTFQQVQKYERGTNRVSASMLVKAARFLKVPAADLLPPDDGVESAPDYIHRVNLVPGAAEVLNTYCALKRPPLRRALLQFIRVMAQDAADGEGER